MVLRSVAQTVLTLKGEWPGVYEYVDFGHVFIAKKYVSGTTSNTTLAIIINKFLF